jgi:prolyl-tRNA synthetase
MRQSQLFTKTLKESPKDEVSINAILLERAGFIYKFMAGVYVYLPLGMKVLKKVADVLREEMNSIGGQEIYMSALQPKNIWDTTGRWEDLKEVMYQFEEDSGKEIGLAITHEEPITLIAKKYISSYKDLPIYIYQIQTKFRNEPRAKSGLLRGREFIMKDLYSFDRDQEGLNRSYEILKEAYLRYFQRVGIEVKVVEAAGGTFTKEFTHEFQAICPAGEDKIIYCKSCDFAQNTEISKLKPGKNCPKCGNILYEEKTIEVGHIYKLGTKYSEAFNLFYSDENNKNNLVFMGSYGIGLGRVIGAIVEINHDEKGIIWPDEVSPFDIHLIDLGKKENDEVSKKAEEIYYNLQKAGIDVLWDDRRDKTAGEKFSDADLIGIPIRAVLSERTLKQNSIEIKRRNEESGELLKIDDIANFHRNW